MHAEATTESPLALAGIDTIVVGVFEGERVAHDFGSGTLQGLLDRGEAKPAFKHLALAHADSRRVILVGLGDREQFDAERARIAAGVAHSRARELGTRSLCWELPHHVDDAVAAGIVEGTLLHARRFDRYKGPPGTAEESDERGPELERLILSAHHDISEAVHTATVICGAQNRARDLGDTPANDLPPSALARYAQELAERRDGLSTTILDEDQIREAGMGAFAAVAQGSVEGARLIRFDYEGAPADTPRLALIGKAVTFDAGGLSLKPAAKMHEMKFDMCGGAAVIEAIAAIAELHLPIRVLGVVGATENLPSGSAVKPGDIVTALDGTTIEVNNTDAEGRLVLADCIAYARREGCEQLVDVATLTGGIVIALGSTYAGLMSGDDGLARRLMQCGERTGELVWRLPLHREYADMVKGRFAQLANVTEQRAASSITAAELLHHFAGDARWAHIDIAGTAYDVKRQYFAGKDATGFGVRLLVELARGLAHGA